MGDTFILLASGFIYFQISLLVSSYFGEHAPQPYMDEVFHVPQAQQYCKGNYNEWNDKITTLPGLYLLSTSVLRLVGMVANLEEPLDVCNVYNLRLSNVFLSTFTYIIIYKIFAHIHAKRIENHPHAKLLTVLSAFSISLFPLNYFFQFLYYTDSGSTFFVLAAYYLMLKKLYQPSAYVAAISILYRQTNVVWLAFSLALLLVSNLEQLVSKTASQTTAAAVSAKKNNGVVDASTLNAITQQRAKKHSNLAELAAKTPNEAFNKEDFSLLKLVNKIYREDLTGKRLLLADLPKIVELRAIQPFVFTMLVFGFFVFVNKGIVVGDRANHEASLHLVQVFYFVAFACFFSWPSFLFVPKKLKHLATWAHSNIKLILAVLLPLASLVVYNFTYEHPFLLADNRHFTFYLWSRVFRRHALVKYACTPVYLACAYLVYRNLTTTGKSLAWLLVYAASVVIVLVPQRLIEFRYFIIPFYIYRLNTNQCTLREVGAELVFNALLNCATIYLFLFRTFVWPNDPTEIQRFMW